MDRYITLLDLSRSLELLSLLQRAKLFFSVNLSLSLSGAAFVEDFRDQVMAKLDLAHVVLPPKTGESSRDGGIPLPVTIHSLAFRLLAPTSSSAGSRIQMTRVSDVTNVETLSKAPFGKRTPNPIHPTRSLLLLGEKYQSSSSRNY